MQIKPHPHSPSFSGAAVIPNSNAVTRTLARIGNRIPPEICKFCDLEHNGNLKRIAMALLASTLLLGARYFQARNNDERREVFTRDFSAVLTAIYAVPILKNFAGKYISKKTGIPIVHGEDAKGWDRINPEKGKTMRSYEQLEKWYSVKSLDAFKERISGGFIGFCENIVNVGGDLNKCFGAFGKEGHEALVNLKNTLRLDKKLSSNEEYIDMFNNAQKSDKMEVKEAFEKIKKLFVEDGKAMNPLHKKASYYKSAIQAIAITASAFLLGIFLPWFNIHYTRNVYLKPKKNTPKPNETKLSHQGNGTINTPTMNEKFKQFQSGLL